MVMESKGWALERVNSHFCAPVQPSSNTGKPPPHLHSKRRRDSSRGEA